MKYCTYGLFPIVIGRDLSRSEAKIMTFKKNLLAFSILACGLAFSATANAQLEQQTGIADPGRLDRTLGQETLVPQAGPNISIKSAPPLEAPAGAENIKFKFGGIELVDSYVYAPEELTYLYKDMIGQEISLADVYALANRMTLKYRNDGYILTRVMIPPQTIESGIPKLQAVEGFIDSITIEGGSEKKSALKIIEQYASRISEGGALTIEALERNLLLINDLPGVNARTIISPSPTTPGGADILIIVDRDPFSAEIGANNFGSRFLGPLQLSASGTTHSIYGWNESITAQVVVAPDEGFELGYGAFTYAQPVGRYGTILSAGFSITDTDPGFTLEPFDVKGLSKSMSLKAEHPVIRSRNMNLSARLGFDWRNVTSKNNAEPTRKDQLRVVRAGAKWDFLDRLLGVAVNTFDFQLSQGIGFFGASDEGDANMSRALGDPSFTKAEIQVQRLQRITDSVNLLLQGHAQLSNNPLLSSEEFGLGGYYSVRGYDPSEVVGDDGMSGKIELQWNTPKDGVQVFGFLDSGTVWDKDPTTPSNARNSLSSTGLGARLELPHDYNAEFAVAQPLHRDIAVQGDRDPEFFLSLTKKF